VLNDKAQGIFYHDANPHDAEMAMASTVKQSAASFETKCTHSAAEVKASKTYIACRQDEALPIQGQIQLARAAYAKVVELECGHSPFLKTEESARVIDIIIDAATA